MADRIRLERNLALYPVYAGGINGLAWAPVFFLYFGSLVPFERVLQLEAIYYSAVVLFEVPSGYFSDAVGRVRTMRIAGAGLLGSYLLFWQARGFLDLAVAQVLLAAGIACNSGTDASFHFDTLASLQRESEFTARESRTMRVALVCQAVAAIAGGLAGSVALGSAYLVAACFVSTAGVAALAFVEPRGETAGHRARLAAAVSHCAATLRLPPLRWLFGFGVLMTVVNHVPYELYQPYIEHALAGLGARSTLLALTDTGRAVPLVAGGHAAAALLLAAWVAPWGAELQRRSGTAAALLVPAALQMMVIGAMAWIQSIAVVPLVLLRVAPRGLMNAPYRDAVLRRLPAGQRATWLSIESLAGRLAFAGFLAALSLAAGAGDVASSRPLFGMLRVGLVIGLIGFAWLWLRRDYLGSHRESENDR